MGHWTSFEPLPLFFMHLATTENGLCRLGLRVPTNQFAAELSRIEGEQEWSEKEDPLLREAKRQLGQYFQRELKQFRLPLDLRGTEFQRRVWEALLSIPYGETRSYADIARAVGSPGAVRAVGSANGANPVAIIVPCHRVVASDGSLCGYGAGLEYKRILLSLEAGTAQQPLFNKLE